MKTMKSGMYFNTLVVKKSKFTTIATNVGTKEDALEFIKEHSDPEATHNCWAYKVGVEAQSAASNDDGEPRGTAGAPILNVIEKNDITNFVILVIREFGGIELGAGPLTRTYSKAASSVVVKKNIIPLVEKQLVQIHFPITEIKLVETVIRKNKWKLVNGEFDAHKVTYTFVTPNKTPINFHNDKVKLNSISSTYNF